MPWCADKRPPPPNQCVSALCVCVCLFEFAPLENVGPDVFLFAKNAAGDCSGQTRSQQQDNVRNIQARGGGVRAEHAGGRG